MSEAEDAAARIEAADAASEPATAGEAAEYDRRGTGTALRVRGELPDVAGLENRAAMDAYEAAGYCGARLKSQPPDQPADDPLRCTQTAGWDTDHTGQGRCKLHGGRTPIKHGMYTSLDRPRIRDLYEEFRQNPDPLNLLDELAMLRALARDYIERYDADKESRELWYASIYARQSEDPTLRKAADRVLAGAKPRQPMDVADAWRILSEVTKVAKRIEDIRAQNAISRQDLFRVLREMGRVVRKHNGVVDGDERLRLIERDWQRIAL